MDSARHVASVLTAICLCSLLAACPPATRAKRRSRPATRPAERTGPAGFSDSGEFKVYVRGSPVAVITFQVHPDGRYQSRRTLSFAGQKLVTDMKVEAVGGKWNRVVIRKPRGPVVIVRKGGKAVRTYLGKGATVELKPGAVLYEGMAPALLSRAVLKYDRRKRGKQKVWFLFAGRGVRVKEGSLDLKEDVERTVAGRKQRFLRFVLGLPGADLDLWTDEAGRVCLLRVPARYVMVARVGYEALGADEETDPKISKPVHKVVVQRSVKVPMRDGVALSTDIYRPKGPGKFPVILIRTPYKKEMVELNGRYYATRGYAVAIQDCRGRFGSKGVWEPFVNEAKDGYDAVEWLAKQPWSTGKVGMIGGSYVGWVQWWALSQRPPHLVTIIPNVAPPDPFYNIPYEYGVFFLLGAIWWADILETKATGSISGVAMEKIAEKKYSKLLKSLPVVELDKKVLGKKNPYWRKWIAHPTNDAFWQPANFLGKLKNANIPVFHQSGWFDGDGIGTKLNFLKMQFHRHKYQKLILGPWGHTATAHRRYAGRDFGPRAIINLQREYLRWFDRWLKGTDNGIEKEPLVRIFVMGTNRWLTGNRYPLLCTRFQDWYLTSGGKANTSKGDGRLVRSAPKGGAARDRYVYDPGDPTPDPDYWEEPERPKGSVVSVEKQKAEREAHHEKVTSSRKDILVFRTRPFAKPYTIAGPMHAVIYAASTARDTDWFVRLLEVDPKGRVFRLALGKIRARFRKSMSKPALLRRNRVYEYVIDMWQTGITIPAGNRLRVEVSSASFPMFSRNLNTGGHNETETRFVKATQTIYHSRRYRSRIVLPAIPPECLRGRKPVARKTSK